MYINYVFHHFVCLPGGLLGMIPLRQGRLGGPLDEAALVKTTAASARINVAGCIAGYMMIYVYYFHTQSMYDIYVYIYIYIYISTYPR